MDAQPEGGMGLNLGRRSVSPPLEMSSRSLSQGSDGLPRAWIVWRRWRSAELSAFPERWRRHWRVGDGALLLHLGYGLAIPTCELALWPAVARHAFDEVFARWALPSRWVAASLVVLAAGNVLAALAMGWRSAGRRSGLILASALPLVGLVTLPLGWLADPPRRRTGSGSWIPLAWLSLGNLVWMIGLSGWLLATAGSRSRSFSLLATGVLHAVAFCAARLAAREPERLAPSLRGRRWRDLLWLLPAPIPLLPLLTSLHAGHERRRAGSLAHAGLLGRGFDGSPVGARLAERAHDERRGWSAWVPGLRPSGPQPSSRLDEATRRFLVVVRWKVAGLLLDGFALVAVAAAAGGFASVRPGGIPRWGMLAMVGAVAPLGVATALGLVQRASSLVGLGGDFVVPLERWPCLRSVALGGLSLFLGVFWGVGFATAGFRDAFLAVLYGWGLAVQWISLTFMMSGVSRGRRDPSDPWFWLGFFTASPWLVAAAGWLWAATGSRVAIAVAAAAASLGWSVAVALAGAPHVLHPLATRRLRDPRVPQPLRRALAFLLATLAMPFGGLLAPAWIWLRARFAAAMTTISLGDEATRPGTLRTPVRGSA